jgi:hypothetical protein
VDLIYLSPVVDCCGHGIEPSGSLKDRRFLGYLNDHHLLKK